MTRDVAAAVVVVTLVSWAFYATLGGHAEPKPGAAGARDLTGMTNPHVTQQNIRSTICRRGWEASVRPSYRRSRPRTSPSLGRRSAAQCRLRDASQRHPI
jgi:hypothetical protein